MRYLLLLSFLFATIGCGGGDSADDIRKAKMIELKKQQELLELEKAVLDSKQAFEKQKRDAKTAAEDEEKKAESKKKDQSEAKRNEIEERYEKERDIRIKKAEETVNADIAVRRATHESYVACQENVSKEDRKKNPSKAEAEEKRFEAWKKAYNEQFTKQEELFKTRELAKAKLEIVKNVNTRMIAEIQRLR